MKTPSSEHLAANNAVRPNYEGHVLSVSVLCWGWAVHSELYNVFSHCCKSKKYFWNHSNT